VTAPQPDISIVIPVHNRADMLRAAIGSCAPSAPGLEVQVIVVDDASAEDVGTTAKSMGADFERLEVNSGSSVARNRGLALVRGRYVKFLDSDDVLVAGALSREFDAAERTGADIVVAGWQDSRLDARGNDIIIATYNAPRFDSIADDLLAGRAAPTSAVLYSTPVARKARWDPKLAKLNDWDFFVSAALHASRIESVDGPSYFWRQHSGARITSSTTFVGNALEFYAILAKLQRGLEERGDMTPARRQRLAQYLYKELRGLYRFHHAERHAVLARILELDPDFVPRDEEQSAVFRSLGRVIPLRWLLGAYGLSRSAMDRMRTAA